MHSPQNTKLITPQLAKKAGFYLVWFGKCGKIQNKMTKQRYKEVGEEYANKIQRRNSTASVISALLWLCGVISFGASFYLNYFPLLFESLVFMALAWLVGLTIKR